MESSAFWIAAALMTAACLAAIVRAVWTADRTSGSDVDVYRDQLRELDRDLARGTLTEADAAAARAEVARRLLAADRDAARSAPRRRGARGLAAALAALLVAGVALATYLDLGAPGYPDLPLRTRIALIEENRAARPGQAVAEAEVPDVLDPDADPQVVAMVERLREVLDDRPDDLRGWRLSARFEAGLGDLEAAWRAQDRVVALLGDDAAAAEFSNLAELMIQAAGGYVSPEAERALAEALRRDPGDGLARYYAGLMYAQGGRPDLAWPIWRRLVGDSAPDAPWLPPLYAQVERVSQLAGDPTPLDALPRPGARGPDAAAIAAAEALSPEERVEMIGGMVEGLAARLADEGGPPADWARLVTAYGVMGRADAAAQVYAEARTVFADSPDALDTLARAAERAGLAP